MAKQETTTDIKKAIKDNITLKLPGTPPISNFGTYYNKNLSGVAVSTLERSAKIENGITNLFENLEQNKTSTYSSGGVVKPKRKPKSNTRKKLARGHTDLRSSLFFK